MKRCDLCFYFHSPKITKSQNQEEALQTLFFEKYDDVDQHAHSLVSEFIFYDTSKISLKADILRADNGVLMTKDFNASFHSYGPSHLKDFVFFLFPETPGAIINGVATEKISCYKPEDQYHFISPSELKTYVLGCSKEKYQEILVKNRLLEAGNCYWRQKELCCISVKKFIKSFFEKSLLSENGLVTLMDYVVNHLSSVNKFKTEKIGDRKIKNVFEYIWANRFNQIFIYEICDLFDLPRRTLEYNYKRFFKISPGQHIKYIKLGLVRRLLLEKSVNFGDIIYTLEDLGIHHPGHFGQAYKSYFGESMSETLNG